MENDRLDRIEGQLVALTTVVALILQRSPDAKIDVQLAQHHQTVFSRLIQAGAPEAAARAAHEVLGQVLAQDPKG